MVLISYDHATILPKIQKKHRGWKNNHQLLNRNITYLKKVPTTKRKFEINP